MLTILFMFGITNHIAKDRSSSYSLCNEMISQKSKSFQIYWKKYCNKVPKKKRMNFGRGKSAEKETDEFRKREKSSMENRMILNANLITKKTELMMFWLTQIELNPFQIDTICEYTNIVSTCTIEYYFQFIAYDMHNVFCSDCIHGS